MRHAAVTIILVLLLLPIAASQRTTRPIEGAYTDVYMVSGRVVDAHGMPFAEASVQIEITSRKFNVEAKQYGTDCRGEFVAYFQNLPALPVGARVKVEPLAKDAKGVLVPFGSASALLDPFFRRTDLNVTMPGTYDHRCDTAEGLWNNTISVRSRVLNRTAPYTENNQTFEAKVYEGIIRMRYTAPDGTVTCPPEQTGGSLCHLFITDERGDVKYTWIFPGEIPSRGSVSIILQDNSTYTAPVDPMNRRAVVNIEATGQGAPPIPQETPFVPIGATLVVALGLALALRRRR